MNSEPGPGDTLEALPSPGPLDEAPEPESARDWFEWHAPYEQPGSALAFRLAAVQSHILQAIEAAPPGEVRVVSFCAGQGRDLLGVLGPHPRRNDVRARLVELDPRNVAFARQSVTQLGLDDRVEVREGDAADRSAYAGLLPAQLVICCGVFGNVSNEDVHRIVDAMPGFCDRGATLVWTRHRRPPDLTVEVRRWVAEAGFEEIAFTAPEHLGFVGVGAARWPGEPGGDWAAAGERLFTWRPDLLPPG